MNLGKLEAVELRDIWSHEATDFTPWLARDENIKLLSDAIRIELEVEGTERSVGAFNADILCKDTVNDNWVLIENQLEKTDHTHLGQLLTYAAGLKTVTIVWIAKKFTDEHRAALDWLNEITDDKFSFFGIEIELWRIGDSAIAPNFKLVSKPNDWSKTITKAASNVDVGDLSDTKKLQLEYWTLFGEFLSDNSALIRPQKARAQHWTSFAIGRSQFHMSGSVNTIENNISIALIIRGEDAKPHFHLLFEKSEEFERAFGEKLEWHEKPERKESWIRLSKDVNIRDKSDWGNQHQWMQVKLEKMHKVFSTPVKQLNAEDWELR